MIKGTNPVVTEDLLVNIFSSLPYATKVGFRQVCTLWKKILENTSLYPLLNKNTIFNAQQYLRANDHNPQLTRYKKLISHYASLHPSDNSSHSLIIRFKCKWVEETEKGWQDAEPVTEALIPVNDVLLFASKFGKHDVQYMSFSNREQRHQFISTYLNLPNTAKHPRSIFLDQQSYQSLMRLKESLTRYTEVAYTSLIPEIESVIEKKKLKS